MNRSRNRCVCVPVCALAGIFVFACLYVCTYITSYVHMYMHACMYACSDHHVVSECMPVVFELAHPSNLSLNVSSQLQQGSHGDNPPSRSVGSSFEFYSCFNGLGRLGFRTLNFRTTSATIHADKSYPTKAPLPIYSQRSRTDLLYTGAGVVPTLQKSHEVYPCKLPSHST